MSDSIKKWEEYNEKFDPELNQVFPGYYTTTTISSQNPKIEEREKLITSKEIIKEINIELINKNVNVSNIKEDDSKNVYFNITLDNKQNFKVYVIEEKIYG